MRRLTILGTGCAMVTKCYNTCFALDNGSETLLVDTGGGNGILTNLERAGIPIEKIRSILISHRHNDHIVGMIWMVRAIATSIIKGKYSGNLDVYCTSDVAEVIRTICLPVLQDKFTRYFDDRIIFNNITDGQQAEILGWNFTFFDILSKKDQQFGFLLRFPDGYRLTYLGDEPYKPDLVNYSRGSDLLLHEAYCLYEDRDKYKPYEKFHATVRDAAMTAEAVGAKRLLLYHTEDAYIGRRREVFTAEAQSCYNGSVLVPEDLDVIDL